MTNGSSARWVLLGVPHVLVPDRPGPLRHEFPETAPAYLGLYLAAQRGWSAREHLAALLWPELAEDRGIANLRVALNRLNRLLGAWGLPDALIAERRRVRLDAPSDLADAATAAARGDWITAAELPGGPLLQGVQFTPYPALAEWLTVEREAARRAWRKALMEAAATATGAAAAEEPLARYLSAHPSDAEVVALQAARLAATGRRPQAADLVVAFRRAAAEELPAEEIDAAVRQVELAMAGLAAADPTRAGRSVLVGREAELETLGAAMREHRWVTLVGLPGTGKSTLAAAWIERQDETARRRIVHVRVNEHTGADAMAAALLSRLDGHSVARRGSVPLAERLGPLEGCLVLDGLDPAFDDPAAADFRRSLATGCPRLRVLATARAPLSVQGEHVIPVGGLDERQTDGRPGAAMRLLLREAARAAPGQRWSSDDPDVARIVRLTAGLPLALRLAAAWSGWLGPGAVADEIERAAASGTGPVDASPRVPAAAPHGNLAVGASILPWLPPLLARLTEAERHALLALALFPRCFDLVAATAVAAAAPATIDQLVARGLLEAQEQGSSPVVALHPLVRTFASARLAELPTLRRSAIERFLALVERWLDVRRTEFGQPVIAHGHLAGRLDEVLAAWPLALETGALTVVPTLVQALLTAYEAGGSPVQGARRLAAAWQAFDEAVPAEAAVLARVQAARATLHYRAADYDAAEALALDAQRLAAATGQRRMQRMALNVLGLSRWMLMRLDDASAVFDEGLQSAVDDGEERGEAIFGGNKALLEKSRGNYAAAEVAWRRVIEVERRLGHWWGVASSSNSLGNLLRHLGRLDECEAIAQESLRLTREHDLTTVRPFALIGLALLRQVQGRPEEAARYLDLVDACAPESVEGPVRIGAAQVRATLALARGDAPSALDQIARAVRLALDSDDVMNRGEALALYGRWLAGPGGDARRACALWAALWHAPTTHAPLRDEIAQYLAAHGEQVPPPARDPTDLLLVAEQVLAAARH